MSFDSRRTRLQRAALHPQRSAAVSEVRPTPLRYREAAGSDSGNEYPFVAKVACETLNPPAVFVTVYASKAPL
jgi:hypothetical protein